ncbi:hypothetical protein AOB46_13105 [Chryseobacterium indologenes]|uniref:Uncharacterized protein n=1 Tax=Chryseobacterium indologenes TaxID=253 RepID=A0A0N0IVS2_CHRID|nr:hypothetical protein AOB46_13105 [Chryseobacterium indologenes]
MNFSEGFIIIALATVFNITVYILFKKYFYGRENAGLRFLTINIPKDVIWLLISLLIIDKTNENFLFLLGCFVVASFLIYMPIIKLINKS